MTRSKNLFVAGALASLALFAAAPAQAASVVKVDQATWGSKGVPTYVNMYIYVPDKPAEKPPLVVGCHSCGTPVSGYTGSIKGILAAADKNGFIVILPEATGQNCWDVGSAKSLKHDGGGDTQAISQMVKYAITKYKADTERVYVMGGSSGAMMTQALIAVYPDIFKAGAERAGVPAGCWADGYSASNQWSDRCANGQTTKTDMQWGDGVRAMFPEYKGPRRRMMMFHGTADTTISPKNLEESVKEWTNVLGLSATPTSMDTTKTSISTYARRFWKNACGYTVLEAWAGQNGGHSMGYEEDAILAFFGLDKAGGTDPETPCDGSTGGGGGAGGTGGVNSGNGGNGGATSSAGAGGVSAMGGAHAGGMSAASGGATSNGNGGSATGNGSGGSNASGGAPGSGGALGSGGAPGSGGALGSGGSVNSASGGRASAGATATAGSSDTGGGDGSNGCSCSVVGQSGTKSAYSVALSFGLALLGLRRRQRSAARRNA